MVTSSNSWRVSVVHTNEMIGTAFLLNFVALSLSQLPVFACLYPLQNIFAGSRRTATTGSSEYITIQYSLFTSDTRIKPSCNQAHLDLLVRSFANFCRYCRHGKIDMYSQDIGTASEGTAHDTRGSYERDFLPLSPTTNFSSGKQAEWSSKESFLEDSPKEPQNIVCDSNMAESRLLALAPELRNIIYDIIFTKTTIMHSHMRSDSTRSGGRVLQCASYRIEKATRPPNALLQTSCVLRSEADPLYYARTTFVFHNADALSTFFACVPPAYQAHIRAICLSVAAARVYRRRRPYLDVAKDIIRDRHIFELRNSSLFRTRRLLCEGALPERLPCMRMPQLPRELVAKQARVWQLTERPLRIMLEVLTYGSLPPHPVASFSVCPAGVSSTPRPPSVIANPRPRPFAHLPRLKYLSIDIYPDVPLYPLHTPTSGGWLSWLPP